jgi:hypothetical protein
MKIIMIAVLALFTVSAHAGILVEPYLGFGASTVKTEDTSGVPGSDSSTGIGMGLRLGYKFLLPWVALDYRLSSGEKLTDSVTQEKINASQTQMGVTGGVDLPLVRLFAGYGFDNKFTVKPSSGDVVFKGTYTKLGAGFSLIPLIKINLEYIINTYPKFSTGGTEYDRSVSYNKFDHTTLFLSVSAPFNL